MPTDANILTTKQQSVHSNEILIRTTDGTQWLIVLQGQTPPKISAGFGGWQIVERARRVALTQYQGKIPWQLQLNLMFDGLIDRVGQEHRLRVLTWMGVPPEGESEPLPVTLYGALPFPSGGEWVINDIQYGDNVIWEMSKFDGSPVRLRQDVTVSFLQHVVSDRLAFTDPGVGLAPQKPKIYIVKDGDTIRRIAQFFYGDYTRWRDIATANVLSDPDHLKVGMRLKLP